MTINYLFRKNQKQEKQIYLEKIKKKHRLKNLFKKLFYFLLLIRQNLRNY